MYVYREQVPVGMVSVLDAQSQKVDLRLKVNRALWREVPYDSQRQIRGSIYELETQIHELLKIAEDKYNASYREAQAQERKESDGKATKSNGEKRANKD